MTDTPDLHGCYGSDTWKKWEICDVSFESTAFQMSPDGNFADLPH